MKKTLLAHPLLILALGALGQWALAQGARPLTQCLGAGAYALGVFLFLRASKGWEEKGPAPLATSREAALFGLIMALAAFLRLYRIGEVPDGLYYDPAGLGVMALRLLQQGIRPNFIIGPFAPVPSYVVYLLAAWFRFVPPTQAGLVLFFDLFALASLALIYWTFRQLSGSRLALLTLFFLSIMDWHLTFSRNGYQNLQVVFYMFGTLAFLLHGLRTRKTWAFLVAALFFAGGLYTYQAYKLFLILLPLYLILEARRTREFWNRFKAHLLAFLGLFLVLSAPVVADWVEHGALKSRETSLFIGKAVGEEKSLAPLAQKALETALMFNSTGDPNSRNGIPGHRVLDDVSGFLFVFGLALAFQHRGRREYLYALLGFLVMALPGPLTRDPAQLHRMVGAIPFTAFLIAASFQSWASRLARAFPEKKAWRRAALGVALALAAAQNSWTYFVDQAGNNECWKASSIAPTWMAREILQKPDASYFLAPAFYEHYTTQFLAASLSSRIQELDLSRLNGRSFDPSRPRLCFALDAGKGPTLALLESLYPGGKEKVFRDLLGTPLAFIYSISTPQGPFSPSHGLTGRFIEPDPLPPGISPVRRDPLINFTNIGDFGGVRPPFSIRWEGRLRVPASGRYGFLALTSDEAHLWLDGKLVLDGGFKECSADLKGGWHSLVLIGSRKENPEVAMDFHLLWKKPGDAAYAIIPSGFFGEMR